MNQSIIYMGSEPLILYIVRRIIKNASYFLFFFFRGLRGNEFDFI